MFIFTNLDLLSVGITTAAIGILGFIIYFNEPNSSTNKNFLGFCLLTILWGLFNYLSYQVSDPKIAFWLLRLGIFTAVWHVLLLFQLLNNFPNNKWSPAKWYEYALLPTAIIISIINLTPLTFKAIEEISSEGRILKITNGPGIALFGTYIFGMVSASIVSFIKKIRRGNEVTPRQIRPILFGIILTFVFILIFNFIFPAILGNSSFIKLGGVFIFPFIVGTGYSIFKHKLLSVKVVSTEILTFVLALVVLLEVIASTDITTTVFRSSIFLLVVGIGILLIRSVISEVKQREELQKLSVELADANEKLKALDLARAEFISIASHQLRTPPATIKWYLSAVLAGDYGKLPDESVNPLRIAQQTTNSLISLIEDLLNVSRIERGTMEFLFEQTDLKKMARTTYDQLLPIAGDKHLKLSLYVSESLPEIMADREKLRQVMNNLIDNAIKYTKEGRIDIRLETLNGKIRFSVKDTGKGIAPETQTEIFQKFKRGKESIKQSAGLGLGLYVAKIIVEQHQGKIWAESEGEDKGSTFLFEIPLNNHLEKTTLFALGDKVK